MNNGKKVIDEFKIPEELALQLSDLLIKQSIRDRMLQNSLGDPDKFEQIEAMLIPIEKDINMIKNKIGSEYVPEQYRSSKYSWNYDGWDIAVNIVQILAAE